MVIQLKPRQTFGELLGQSLGQGISGAIGQRAERNLQQQQFEQQAQILQQMGIDPSILLVDKNLQGPLLNKMLKPKSWGETLRNVGERTLGYAPTQRPGMMQQQPQTLNIDGQQVPINEFSAATQQALQMDQAEQPTWTQAGIGAGVGAGSTLLQSLLGFAPDIASAGLRGLKGMSSPLFEGEQQQRMTQAIQNELSRVDPNSERAKELRSGLEFIQQSPDIRAPLGAIEGVLPTTERTISGINKAAESVGLGEQFGKSPRGEFLGQVGGILANPSKWTSLAGAFKDILKAGGVAVGGEAAKFLTQDLTGSKLLGDLVQAGTYLGYSMFPGSLGSLADARYKQLDGVVKEVEGAGKTINMKPYEKRFDQLANKIEKEFTYGSPEYNFLGQEANRLSNGVFGQTKVSPSLLLNETKSMSGRWNKVPDQAKEVFKNMIDLQREALNKTLNAYKPGSGELLTQANDLYRKNAQVGKLSQNIAQSLYPRKLGLGTLAYVAGAYRPLLAAGAATVGKKYLSSMINSPTFRSALKELAKAQAAGNISLVNKLADRLNNEAERLLKRLPKKAQEEIRQALTQQFAE